MFRVDIYIEADSTAPRKTAKRYAYVLECRVEGDIKTREGFGEILGTYHQVILTGLSQALGRMKEPSEIHIHTQDAFVLNMIRTRLSGWAKNGFFNTQGDPVANREEWEAVHKLTLAHLIQTEPGIHPYYAWMITEMRKRGEKYEPKE